MFKRKRVKAEDEWQGTVVHKRRAMPDGSMMLYFVKVELADGETRKFRIKKDLWASLEVGDRLVKRAGEPEPVKQ
ncbi:DUF7489 domain-containing protein [Actinacidiphila alni]|uniref:DUF7489 domain-containing protein n=1 Tax=Actinacidiphila alni TaxID=380248 RepID=A0A1I2JMJ3_9ACTN|nr:hypothetical protein [Actinacidiphila alni]SFF53901.1 hypothetical protein SAMN05216251_11815 [Actinacidiphila alni]